MKPCNCNKAEIGPFTSQQCRICWLSLNDLRYRKLWKIYSDDKDKQKLLLTHHLSAGDCLVMTAALESLHTNFPDKYITDVEVSVKDCFLNNPHVRLLDRNDSEVKVIQMHYDVNQSDKKPIHFMEAFCDYLGKQLNIDLK